MTIDLTRGADAGWLSFSVTDEGDMDDGTGRRRLRVTRGRDHHAIIACETDADDVPLALSTIDRSEKVRDGWLDEAHKWLWTQVFVTGDTGPPPADRDD